MKSNMQSGTRRILETKKHFEVLDGLRGVAALAVVIFHFMEWVYTDYSKNFIGHGFLAVDFFFCLSGFVIGYAYDERIATMGKKQFFLSRLIRLQPLVILGSILGLLAFFLDPFSTYTAAYGAGKMLLILLCSLLLIPYPAMEERAFNLFSLNAPAWSLFWEYVANIVYAYALCKMKRRYLPVLMVMAALWLGYISYTKGNLMGGWSGDNFWDGGARIAYSFLAGLFIYRMNWVIPNRLGFIGLAILLSAAFLAPWPAWDRWLELGIVLCYFPLMIALGAGASLSPAVKKLAVFSGQLSYPLYMTHYAAIWIFGNYFTKYKPGTNSLWVIITIGTTALILVAWLVMVLYDIPLRRYLTNKRKRSFTE